MPEGDAKTVDKESGVNPRRLNPMQRRRAKYESKFSDITCKDADWKSDKVINLGRKDTTDTWCCFVLVAFILVTLGLGFYGVAQNSGVPAIAPYDLDGNMCGITPGYESHRFLYFNDMSPEAKKEGIFDSGVCVKNCIVKAGQLPDCKPTSVEKECKAPAFDTAPSGVGLLCGYDITKEPEKALAFKNQITAELKLSKSEARAVAYIIDAVPALAIVIITGGIFSIMWIYAMANCATGIAYVVIGFTELMIAGIILAGVTMPQNTDEEKTQALLLTIMGVIMLVIFNVVLYCKWKNIKIAIAVIDATADFFMNTARIQLVGVFYFLLSAIWFAIWMTLVIGMLGIARYEWKGKDTPTHQERAIIQEEGDNTIGYMILFMFFTLVWVLVYLKDSNVFVLMASVSTYYFNSNASTEGEAEVMVAMNWCHKVHFGSIALGSFIHTIIIVVNIIINAADNASSSANPTTRAIGTCVKCCLKCIEDILDYLNKVAYAYMAISGDKYCTSAYQAFLLNLKYITQFYLANQMAAGFINLGMFLVVLVNIGVFFGSWTGIRGSDRPVMGDIEAVLYLFVVLLTLLIADIFLGLFDEAVVSTLHCMAMDMECNGGYPKFGPPTYHMKMKEVLDNPMFESEREEMASYGNPPMGHPPPPSEPPANMSAQPMMVPAQPGMGAPMPGHGMTQMQSVTTTTTTTQQVVQQAM